MGAPAAVLLQSDDIAELAVPGLPKGTILIQSKAVAIPNVMRGKERTQVERQARVQVGHPQNGTSVHPGLGSQSASEPRYRVYCVCR